MFARNGSDSQSSLVIETVNNGSFTLTEFLLKRGLSPNVVRKYVDGDEKFRSYHTLSWRTPLSIAVLSGRMDLFDLLLDYEADVNFYLLDSHYLDSPLFAAVKTNNMNAVARILSLGASPNEDTCSSGECHNVVHIAASNRDPRMLEELLKHGADPTSGCYNCPSALMAAVKSQSLDAILMLIRKGANVNEPDLFGRTPLARAKDSGLENATEILSDLQAEESISLEKLRSCLEESVELLVSKLLQPPHLGIHSYCSWPLWIKLGRCLCLGKDYQNGIIALEQILDTNWKNMGPPNLRSHCYYCSSWGSEKFLLCEDCDGSVFCKTYIERHMTMFRNSTYSHSVTKFPRKFLRDVPEGQVALDENTYLPVQVWLEGFRGWSAKL